MEKMFGLSKKTKKKKDGKYLNQDGNEQSDIPFIDFFKQKLFEYMSALSEYINNQTKFKSIKTNHLKRIYQDKSFGNLKKKKSDELTELNPEMISIINYNNLDCVTTDSNCDIKPTDDIDIESSSSEYTNQDTYFNFSLVHYYPFLNKLNNDGLNELIRSTRTSKEVYITNLYYFGEDKYQREKSVVLNYTSPITIKVISGFSDGAKKGNEYEPPSEYNDSNDFDSNPSFDNNPSLGGLFTVLSSCLDKGNNLKIDSNDPLRNYFSTMVGNPDSQKLFDILKKKNLIIKCIDIISFEGLVDIKQSQPSNGDESSKDIIQVGKIEFLVRLLDDSMFDQNGNWYPPSTITDLPLSYQQILAQTRPPPAAAAQQILAQAVPPPAEAAAAQQAEAAAAQQAEAAAAAAQQAEAAAAELSSGYEVQLPTAAEALSSTYALPPPESAVPPPEPQVQTNLQTPSPYGSQNYYGGKKKIRNQKIFLKKESNNKQINRSKNNSKRKSFKQTNQRQKSNRLIKTTNKLLKNSKNN
jgi:hypothetical protein